MKIDSVYLFYARTVARHYVVTSENEKCHAIYPHLLLWFGIMPIF
jgi:hypothetical protein